MIFTPKVSKISKCKWCGNYYTKTHNRTQYCGNHCRKQSRLEQKRNWEHHRRKTDPQYRKEELGTIGSISQHKHLNPEMEATIVRKALLQIRGQRLNTYTYREELETVKQSV